MCDDVVLRCVVGVKNFVDATTALVRFEHAAGGNFVEGKNLTLFCLPSRRVSPSWRSCVGLGHLAAASSTPDGAARSTLRPCGEGGRRERRPRRPARARARAGFGGQAVGGAVGGRRGSGGGSTTFGGTPRGHRPCRFTRCISCENLFMTARPSPTLHLSSTHAHRQSSFVGADPRTTGAARATRVDSSAARAPCPRWAAPEARGGADESSSAAIRGAATATHRPPCPRRVVSGGSSLRLGARQQCASPGRLDGASLKELFAIHRAPYNDPKTGTGRASARSQVASSRRAPAVPTPPPPPPSASPTPSTPVPSPPAPAPFPPTGAPNAVVFVIRRRLRRAASGVSPRSPPPPSPPPSPPRPSASTAPPSPVRRSHFRHRRHGHATRPPPSPPRSSRAPPRPRVPSPSPMPRLHHARRRALPVPPPPLSPRSRPLPSPPCAPPPSSSPAASAVVAAAAVAATSAVSGAALEDDDPSAPPTAHRHLRLPRRLGPAPQRHLHYLYAVATSAEAVTTAMPPTRRHRRLAHPRGRRLALRGGRRLAHRGGRGLDHIVALATVASAVRRRPCRRRLRRTRQGPRHRCPRGTLLRRPRHRGLRHALLRPRRPRRDDHLGRAARPKSISRTSVVPPPLRPPHPLPCRRWCRSGRRGRRSRARRVRECTNVAACVVDDAALALFVGCARCCCSSPAAIQPRFRC